MPWEYLQSPELDKRFISAVKLLPKGLVVADINAGSCRFSKYYEYRKYYANDIDADYNPNTDIDFSACDDTVMVDYLRDKRIELLCLWGHGAGHIVKSPYESPSLTRSFIEIAENNNPEFIIIEASQNYEKKYGMLKEIISKLEYTVENKIKTFSDGEYGNRVGFVLKIA